MTMLFFILAISLYKNNKFDCSESLYTVCNFTLSSTCHNHVSHFCWRRETFLPFGHLVYVEISQANWGTHALFISLTCSPWIFHLFILLFIPKIFLFFFSYQTTWATKMKHPCPGFSYSLIKSSATIITFILVLSCFMNVESSRTSGRHLLSPSSTNAFKKAPAYGASHSHGGLEHLSQEFSGPSHGGIGHQLITPWLPSSYSANCFYIFFVSISIQLPAECMVFLVIMYSTRKVWT